MLVPKTFFSGKGKEEKLKEVFEKKNGTDNICWDGSTRERKSNYDE